MARISPASVGPEPLTAGEIARHLRRGKRSGSGFTACCPAHDDRNPTLSLHERDGKILAHCHAGCSQNEVIGALRKRGLWPESESARPWLDPREARQARWFAQALEDLLELALEELPAWSEERYEPTQALMELRRARKKGWLAVFYRDWRRREPRLAAGLVEAGRRSQRRIWARLAGFLEDL